MNKQERLAELDNQIIEIQERRREIEDLPDEPKGDVVMWLVECKDEPNTTLMIIRSIDGMWTTMRNGHANPQKCNDWFEAYERVSKTAKQLQSLSTRDIKVSGPFVPNDWTLL